MNVTYDPVADVFRIQFREVPVVRRDPAGPGMHLEIGHDGSPVGLEIFQASQRVDNPKSIHFDVTA